MFSYLRMLCLNTNRYLRSAAGRINYFGAFEETTIVRKSLQKVLNRRPQKYIEYNVSILDLLIRYCSWVPPFSDVVREILSRLVRKWQYFKGVEVSWHWIFPQMLPYICSNSGELNSKNGTFSGSKLLSSQKWLLMFIGHNSVNDQYSQHWMRIIF